MIELAVLITSSLANILLSLLVYLNNPKQPVNRTFAALTSTLVGIAVVSYLSLHTAEPLLYIRLTMVFATLLVLLFKWFSVWFPHGHERFSWSRRYELVAALVVIVIMLTPLTFSGVHISPDGNVEPTFRPGMAAFIAYFVYMICTSLAILFRRYRHSRGKEHSQILYIISALIFLFSLEAFSSMVLPLVFKVSVGIAFSSLYFAVFASIVSVAIIKRHLFNVRAVVTRAIAYLLVLATLIVLYAAVLFAFSVVAFPGRSIDVQYQIVSAALAVVLALTFPSLRRFFDHLTQRIFYRRAYDSQAVTKHLTEMLAVNTLLHVIMQQSLEILCGSIAVRHATFVVLSNGALYSTKLYGQPPAHIDVTPLSNIVSDLVNMSEVEDAAVKRYLERNGLECIVRLRTTDSIIGYLLLGPKSSGVIYSTQDIDLLQISGKELAVAVQNALHFEEIQNFNKTLQVRVNQATTELRRTNEKLKALDETKDEFITMASHQLRTPLTSVKGYLSMVLEGDAGKLNTNQRKLLDQSYASSQRMVYLISDLLDLSRLNTGKFVIEPVPVDLSKVAQAEVDQLAETAKSRELTLVYNRPAAFPKLMLDETKIHQVVMNLIDNAIYYTPAGGTVTVELRETATAVEYMVHDTGIGVPKAAQHKLFSKFYRAENAQHARPDGTGLGLFMAKKVVVAQGGSIIFQSEQGKGSTFGFRFSKASHAVSDVLPTALEHTAKRRSP